jgi:hypothetical protein
LSRAKVPATARNESVGIVLSPNSRWTPSVVPGAHDDTVVMEHLGQLGIRVKKPKAT